MKVFVWNRIENASNHWHPEGGVVVFAETMDRAVQLAKEAGADIRMDESPDEIRETTGNEKVYIMPDAGCC